MATNVADFTRYLNNDRGVYWQVLFVPLIMSTLGVFGIIGTSCAKVSLFFAIAVNADKFARSCTENTFGIHSHSPRCGMAPVGEQLPSLSVLLGALLRSEQICRPMSFRARTIWSVCAQSTSISDVVSSSRQSPQAGSWFRGRSLPRHSRY